jgi:D-glycero-D-manno-heptose 1,7-bisphosphate phosphatase
MTRLSDPGLWAERYGEHDFAGRPALFLDRDGVIVEEVHFLRHAGHVRLIEGVAEAMAAANAAGVAVVVVTNQSGIARGLHGWTEFEAVQTRMTALLARHGARTDLVLACGYHRDGTGELAKDHPWRKPECGMLHEARDLIGIALGESLIVGDRLTDLEAGKAAGLRQGALVETGYGAQQTADGSDVMRRWEADGFAVNVHPTAGPAIREWLGRL